MTSKFESEHGTDQSLARLAPPGGQVTCRAARHRVTKSKWKKSFACIALKSELEYDDGGGGGGKSLWPGRRRSVGPISMRAAPASAATGIPTAWPAQQPFGFQSVVLNLRASNLRTPS